MPSDLEVSLTDDELSVVVGFLIDYTNAEVSEFLSDHLLPKSGNKSQMRERVERALRTGALEISDIVDYLDGKASSSKQHIFIYDGAENTQAGWEDSESAAETIERSGISVGTFPMRVVLPEALTLTNVAVADDVLSVTAVARRDGYQRRAELDYEARIDEFEAVEYRAYVREIVRNTIRFEWDLIANQAIIQITQLPSGHTYEAVRDEFRDLVRPWLDLDRFAGVDLRKCIHTLQELEEGGGRETRIRAVDFETLGGRHVSGKSGFQGVSLFGEPVVDTAIRAVRNAGVSRTGNFYWLADPQTPLERDVHVYILASNGRVNITTSQTPEVIRHVVERVRRHCR